MNFIYGRLVKINFTAGIQLECGIKQQQQKIHFMFLVTHPPRVFKKLKFQRLFEDASQRGRGQKRSRGSLKWRLQKIVYLSKVKSSLHGQFWMSYEKYLFITKPNNVWWPWGNVALWSSITAAIKAILLSDMLSALVTCCGHPAVIIEVDKGMSPLGHLTYVLTPLVTDSHWTFSFVQPHVVLSAGLDGEPQ